MTYHYDELSRVCYAILDGLGFMGYRVGCDGSFWSCWQITPMLTGRGTTTAMTSVWKRINGRVDKDGYVDVFMKHVTGKHLGRKAHRVVLEAFAGKCSNGMECRHIDGVPANNDLSNLVWGTHLENEDDKRRHGRTNQGAKHGNTLLTDEIVAGIRELHAAGHKQVDICRALGLSRGCVGDVVRRRNWQHV